MSFLISTVHRFLDREEGSTAVHCVVLLLLIAIVGLTALASISVGPG